MKHTCKFAFEKRCLFKNQDKKEILSAVAEVFRAACSPKFSNVEESSKTVSGKGIEICVTFTDDEGIKTYNSEYRKIDKATDVLSFPTANFDHGKGTFSPFDIDPGNGSIFLGDVVISVPRAIAQAEAYGHSLKREIAFLMAHSCLHL